MSNTREYPRERSQLLILLHMVRMISQPRDATELNHGGMIKLSDTPKQNRIYHLFLKVI